MNNEEIFGKAITLLGQTREAFLDRVYHDRPEDRAQMEMLLAAHVTEDSLLASQEPAATEDIAAEPKLDRGETVGPYKLLQRIGEGGMGSLYLAEQLQPYVPSSH